MKSQTISLTESELTAILGNEAGRRLGLPSGQLVNVQYKLLATPEGKFDSLTVTIGPPSDDEVKDP